MEISNSTRLKKGAILLVLFALLINIAKCFKEYRYAYFKKSTSDLVTLNEERMGEVKKMLPLHGVIGYIGDGFGRDPMFDADLECQRTQYNLSPVIVVCNPEQQLVIGNFRNAGAYTKISSDSNLKLTKDTVDIYPKVSSELNIKPIKNFGNGIILFGRDSQ